MGDVFINWWWACMHIDHVMELVEFWPAWRSGFLIMWSHHMITFMACIMTITFCMQTAKETIHRGTFMGKARVYSWPPKFLSTFAFWSNKLKVRIFDMVQDGKIWKSWKSILDLFIFVNFNVRLCFGSV